MDNRELAQKEIAILCDPQTKICRSELAYRLYTLLDQNRASYKYCCEQLLLFGDDNVSINRFLDMVYLLYLYIEPDKATLSRCIRSEDSYFSIIASQLIEKRFTNRYGKLYMENSPILVNAVKLMLDQFRFGAQDNANQDANSELINSKSLELLDKIVSIEKAKCDDELTFYDNPLSMFESPITEPFEVLEKACVETHVDAMCFIERLKGIPLQIHETIQYLEKQRSLKGVELPQVVAQNFYDMLVKMIQIDPPKQEFMKIFETRLSESKLSRAYYDLAVEILRDSVYRALHHVKEWIYEFYLEEDEVPQEESHVKSDESAEHAEHAKCTERTVSEYSVCCDRSRGAQYYAHCLVYHTLTDLTPDEIHELGEKCVRELSADILATVQKLDPSVTTFEEAIEFSRRAFIDPKYIYPDNPDGEADAVKEINRLDQIVKANIDNLFLPNSLPKAVCEYKFTPDHQKETAAGGYYFPPAFDNSVSGAFYSNLACGLTSFGMPTLFAHEAIPGHHFQLSTIAESDMHPLFKIEFYNICNSYVEGWALYSEKLGREIGLYDEMGLLGHLFDDMLRSCRLVVDTGLHHYGWTRAQALEYMNKHVPTEKSNSIEIDRYISWPGQAASYKIGQLSILEERRNALESGVTLQQFNSNLINHVKILAKPSIEPQTRSDESE